MYNILQGVTTMSRMKKIYTEEFKKTLVDLINNGKIIVDVSREYGVSTSNLVGWKKLYTKLSSESEQSITLAEFNKMKKEYLAMKEECDILKKALTIFAKN